MSHFYVQSRIVLFVSVFCLLYSIVLHCLKAFVANDFAVYCMWPHEYWTSRFTKTRGQLYRGGLFFSGWSWLVFGEHVVGFNLSMVQVSSLQIALGHLFLLVTIGGSAGNGNKTTVSEEMRFPVFSSCWELKF